MMSKQPKGFACLSHLANTLQKGLPCFNCGVVRVSFYFLPFSVVFFQFLLLSCWFFFFSLFVSFLTKALRLQHTCLYKGGKSSAHETSTRVIIRCEIGWLVVFPDVVFHLFDQVSITVGDTSCLDVKLVHDCQSIKPADTKYVKVTAAMSSLRLVLTGASA